MVALQMNWSPVGFGTKKQYQQWWGSSTLNSSSGHSEKAHVLPTRMLDQWLAYGQPFKGHDCTYQRNVGSEKRGVKVTEQSNANEFHSLLMHLTKKYLFCLFWVFCYIISTTVSVINKYFTTQNIILAVQPALSLSLKFVYAFPKKNRSVTILCFNWKETQHILSNSA